MRKELAIYGQLAARRITSEFLLEVAAFLLTVQAFLAGLSKSELETEPASLSCLAPLWQNTRLLSGWVVSQLLATAIYL